MKRTPWWGRRTSSHASSDPWTRRWTERKWRPFVVPPGWLDPARSSRCRRPGSRLPSPVPEPSGIVDHRLDLAAVADDAGVLQQAHHIVFLEPGHPLIIEIMKGAPEVFPLGQNGPPAEARLKPFQAQFLKKPAVIAHRKAPFRVMVGGKLRSETAPVATSYSIGIEVGFVHAGWRDQETKNCRRGSAMPGSSSMISAVTTRSATKGSSCTRC